MRLHFSKPPHCQPIPPPRVIFCDVDGTLITSGQVNARLVDWLRSRHSEGYELVLWSSRGREHAEKAASIAGCADLFRAIVSKPGYIVDDKGWSWIKYTRSANALNALSKQANATELHDFNSQI